MSSEETKRPNKDFDFTGNWLPSVTPLRVTGKNYISMANLASDVNGLSGLAGYSRITTLAQKNAPLAVTALTRAAQCQVTCAGHGLVAAGHTVVFAVITQAQWSALASAGHIDVVSIVDEDNIIIDYDTSAFTAAFSLGTQEPTASFYDPVQYIKARSGIHFRPPFTRRSILLVQAANEAETASAVLQQIAETTNDDIPAVKDFEQEVLHTDVSAAGQGRFALWPRGSIAYCNGQESLIYEGPEMNPAKIIFAEAMADPPVNPIDYTEALTNMIVKPGYTASLAAAPDPYTSLYLRFDGEHLQTTTDDSSPYDHEITRIGATYLSTAYKKFGTASAYFPNGTNQAWRLPVHAQFCYAGNNFTHDVQARLYIIVGYGDYIPKTPIFEGYKDADNYFLWYVQSPGAEDYGQYGKIKYVAKTSGTVIADYEWALTQAQRNALVNSFQHLEVCRAGTTMKLFLEGNDLSATVNTAIGSNQMPTLNSGYMYIGASVSLKSEGETYRSARNSWFDTFRNSTGIAQHTSMFTPPAAAYESGGAAIILYTRRPIQSAKFYLNTLNADPGTDITGRVWTGAEYENLIIIDDTQDLSVNEQSIRFNSTVGQAQPRLIAGNMYYAYQFALNAGTAEIIRITVDAPMQPVVDLWDGILRPIQMLRYYKGSKWYDKTLAVLEETPAGAAGHEVYNAQVGGMTSSEYIDLYTSERACAFKITMFTREADKINTADSTMSFYCWDGDGYQPVTNLVDGTATGAKTLTKPSGYVSFNPSNPGLERKKEENDLSFWHYRIKFSATLSANVWIDRVEAVPAPQEMKQAYVFPFMFQARPMLCGNLATGERNRIDYGLAYATEGWNGEESSNGDGRSPLYIGGSDPLTCACEIYNRLGSSIYTFGLCYKPYEIYILHGDNHETFKAYPLNNKIGCPAPFTLDTFTISESQESQSARAVACWLSFQGPYMFDAGGIAEIKGIECYFDARDTRCVNFALIHKSLGWFSANGRKYNLGIPSGAAATQINTWLIYDFDIRKWYPAVPTPAASPYPAAVVRVADEYNKQYSYGFRQNGAVMRLEHGTTYDGDPITQHVETGEVIPNGLWSIIKGQMFKIIGLTTTEPNVSLIVTMYKDGDDTGEVIATIPISATREKPFRYTTRINPGDCQSFRVRIATQTEASNKGMQLLAWGVKVSDERTDNR